MGAYAYIEEDKVIIGNDYIERQFSTKDDRLVTSEIINKRIDGEKSLKLKKHSAEFIVAFKKKKLIGYATDFLSSNNLKLDSVNVLKHRVEFIFKRCSYNGARITSVESIEVGDNDH